MNNIKNLSALIPSQLPEYITSDPTYDKFVLFLQSYYEWMEQANNVLYESKNILNYVDIDNTTNEFLDYFVNDFLQYFPKDSLVDKHQAVKIARELYKSKGTPASYKFLFKVLYDSEFDIFFTKDAVLRASDGIWFVAKSLKLATQDPNFLNIQNRKIFGESSKSIAIIENTVLAGTKTEVFISNIERLFQSGETVRVIDGNNQDVLVDGQPLRAKLVGQISQININSKNRGLLYSPGDPVVVYGGLNPTVENPIGAIAKVGSTTSGSIQKIGVNYGGFGYRDFPNTSINITDAPGAIAKVDSVVSILPPPIMIENGGIGYKVNDKVIKGDVSNYTIFADVTAVNNIGTITEITYRSGLDANVVYGITANVISSNVQATNASIKISTVPGVGIANATYIVKDTISLKTNEVHSGHASGFLLGNTTNPVSYFFSKMPTANINTKLSDAFSYQQFFTYSLSSIDVENGGGGITTLPTVSTESIYVTDVYDPNDSANTLGQNIQGKLSNLGILAPIQIANPGIGYVANDKIIFSGGSGYGASANVTSVDSSGRILAVDYVYDSAIIKYSLGGMGYKQTALPQLSVNSANVSAYGASLFVPGILGDGATFSLSVDRVGSVTSINVTDFGEDYNSTPNVSLKVQDIIVSNVSITNLPKKEDVIYQGLNVNNASYIASVNSISILTYDADPSKSKYNLRVYNYNSNPKPDLELFVDLPDASKISISMANTPATANFFYSGSPEYDINGIKNYGDGTAKATASFLNGLTISQGQYLTTQGQPSAFSILQNENYNNFTYQITVEKEIAKYREILLNLLHPTGMKVLGRYAIKSHSDFNYHSVSAIYSGKTLAAYTGYVSSNVTISGDFINKSNNIVKFDNLAGANIATFITPNNTIYISPINGESIISDVVSVNYSANTITLKDNVWLTFANVAYVSGNLGSNTITVNSITDSYDIVNNGKYIDANNHLKGLIFASDNIKINNNTYKIQSVNYTYNTITLTTNLLANVSNDLITINRTLTAGGSTTNIGQIIILGSVGIPYIPEITTEDGLSLLTEDQQILILG